MHTVTVYHAQENKVHSFSSATLLCLSNWHLHKLTVLETARCQFLTTFPKKSAPGLPLSSIIGRMSVKYALASAETSHLRQAPFWSSAKLNGQYASMRCFQTELDHSVVVTWAENTLPFILIVTKCMDDFAKQIRTLLVVGYCLVSPLHHSTIQCMFIGKWSYYYYYYYTGRGESRILLMEGHLSHSCCLLLLVGAEGQGHAPPETLKLYIKWCSPSNTLASIPSSTSNQIWNIFQTYTING